MMVLPTGSGPFRFWGNPWSPVPGGLGLRELPSAWVQRPVFDQGPARFPGKSESDPDLIICYPQRYYSTSFYTPNARVEVLDLMNTVSCTKPFDKNPMRSFWSNPSMPFGP